MMRRAIFLFSPISFLLSDSLRRRRQRVSSAAVAHAATAASSTSVLGSRCLRCRDRPNRISTSSRARAHPAPPGAQRRLQATVGPSKPWRPVGGAASPAKNGTPTAARGWRLTVVGHPFFPLFPPFFTARAVLDHHRKTRQPPVSVSGLTSGIVTISR